MLALLAACASRPKVSCSLEPPLAVRALPEEVQRRLAVIRRYQCETSCPRDTPPEPHGGMYTMEPRNTSYSDLPSDCQVHAAAVVVIGNDLLRIYGGCDLCVDRCTAGDPTALDDCRRNCSLASLTDHDTHLAQLSTLFSAHDYGFVAWRELLEPLPEPPVARDQPLSCVVEPAVRER